jgi:uncharacterized phage infection (PIP) family protein YhgE
MARAFTAKKSKAGKQIKCGRCGHVIEPGEQYFYFSVGFRGAKQIRCKEHPPKQSELCGSKMSGVYAQNEGIESAIADLRAGKGSPSDLASTLETAADEIDSIRDEYQDGLDSLPENFQNSGSADETREKIDGLTDYADTLRGAASDIEGLDTEPDEGETEDDKESEVNDEAADLAEQALGEFSL